MGMHIENLHPQFQTQSYQLMKGPAVEKNFQRSLARALDDKNKKELYKACQELESVFFSKVMESMRASIPRSNLINRGFATETFESMLFDEYAKEISKTGSLGIADILYKQLSEK